MPPRGPAGEAALDGWLDQCSDTTGLSLFLREWDNATEARRGKLMQVGGTVVRMSEPPRLPVYPPPPPRPHQPCRSVATPPRKPVAWQPPTTRWLVPQTARSAHTLDKRSTKRTFRTFHM